VGDLRSSQRRLIKGCSIGRDRRSAEVYMTTEKEKMLAGELYDPLDPVLVAERNRARDLLLLLNQTREEETEKRRGLIRELFSYESDVWLQPPFSCDYGTNIRLGSGVFFNFNCVVLDVASVAIGDRTLFGPAVQIYAASHPLLAEDRRSGLELGKPVSIGRDVWVGGGAIICPGVTIGDAAVIGAGSVVTHDIPPRVLAAGNPCKVIREL
jgi:maltose O-acetyltransferase